MTESRGSAPPMEPDVDVERPEAGLSTWIRRAVLVVAAALSVFAVYRVFVPDPHGGLPYRAAFLAVTLALIFICFRWDGQPGGRPAPVDWGLAVAGLAAAGYPILDPDGFVGRTFDPATSDLVFGGLAVLLVLEATRRSTGWALPAVCVGFLLYAYYGGYLPAGWAIGHRGYGGQRIVEQLYMTTEGLFGVPLDVAATYIVLFALYGAVLELSGAARFFLDLSLAAFRRSRSAPGRTVTLAGFLLGTVSGSGTATAVSLGAVAWPLLRRAGYPADQGGGVLAAAGIGAILSPPTLGAAAFIIAEYLRVSYLTVMLYALVPTLLYYLGILLAIEIDARRFGARPVEFGGVGFGRLLLRSGYHFSSLFLIIGLLAIDVSVFRAVVIATAVAFALSFLDRRDRMTPPLVLAALARGSTSVLAVTATTAAAGIIVGITTLTGLGLNLSGLIVDAAGSFGGHGVALLLTAALSAVAVLVLGLAVPVTASFVIAAVIIAPALRTLGVGDAETYMFVFYYAVLSEVSPPTALAAVASAAITGGDPYRTTFATFRYTLPAFLVPFAVVLTPAGSALLGRAAFPEVLLAALVSAIAVAALAAATGGWLVRAAGVPERLLCTVAAVLLLFLEPVPVIAGLVVLALAVGLHLLLRDVHGASP
ncbi:MAG TPA: TRAP transporter fused permease subunit [Kineosporiaceae bacterium]|nr:TRAP transporter fused permease subunit [Kineosporiaceae bacterium]